MKILVDDDFIQNVNKAYSKLGFRFSDSDLSNFEIQDEEYDNSNNNYNGVRVTYTNEDHTSIEKTLGELTLADINSAYAYSNEIATSRDEVKENTEAYKYLQYNRVEADVKFRINKKLIKKRLFDSLESNNSIGYPIEVVNNTNGIKNAKQGKYEIQKAPSAEVAKKENKKQEVRKMPKNEIIERDDTEQEIITRDGRNAEMQNLSPRNKVVQVEDNRKVADKGRSTISADSVMKTAGMIILAGAIAFAAYSCGKYSSYNAGYNNEIGTQDNKGVNNDVDIDNSITNVVNNQNTNNDVVDEPTKEETPVKEEPVKETAVEETTVEEEVKTEINVHSDEYITDVVDNVINTIQLNGDGIVAAKYDRDLVDALVRYTHHNYPEYTGENILSNEVAYEDMSELISRGFDISLFYKGLNNYDNLHALYNATKNLKQEKGQYEDEFKIYMCMDVVMNEMIQTNFPEAIALRAYVDNYSIIPSMQMARQQAGVLEMKDTQDLWKDVNKDGKITYEENAEGKGYNDEKAAAMAAKYGEMDSQKCAQIYNRIKTDGNNSELTQIVYKAIDEDEARTRTR